MFQHRHYENIAALFRRSRNEIDPVSWDFLVHRASENFARDNSRFQPARFLAACGVV